NFALACNCLSTHGFAGCSFEPCAERMGDRAVYCARLESVCAERHWGFESPPSVSIVARARKVACITVSHNKSADFRRNPTLSFEVSSDRETGEWTPSVQSETPPACACHCEQQPPA